MFIPQRSYIPFSTLKDALLYPKVATKMQETKGKELLELLDEINLSYLKHKLNSKEDWYHILSLGEQQSLAFGRAAITNPEWLFLDEATSAMDEYLENKMYDIILKKMTSTTIISVGHRSTLNVYHKRSIRINPSS